MIDRSADWGPDLDFVAKMLAGFAAVVRVECLADIEIVICPDLVRNICQIQRGIGIIQGASNIYI